MAQNVCGCTSFAARLHYDSVMSLASGFAFATIEHAEFNTPLIKTTGITGGLVTGDQHAASPHNFV
ncbi:MAG: hypothetical protein IH587_00115 [Anaerolineae bacterium]|nr:hypothetical protein [Anaerolineae bacterium]